MAAPRKGSAGYAMGGVEDRLGATQVPGMGAQRGSNVVDATMPLESTVRLPGMLAPGTAMPQEAMKAKSRTATDLKAARETRANEALKMKDEQLRILSDQNSQVGILWF
jgi:hypothetical protein